MGWSSGWGDDPRIKEIHQVGTRCFVEGTDNTWYRVDSLPSMETCSTLALYKEQSTYLSYMVQRGYLVLLKEKPQELSL